MKMNKINMKQDMLYEDEQVWPIKNVQIFGPPRHEFDNFQTESG